MNLIANLILLIYAGAVGLAARGARAAPRLAPRPLPTPRWPPAHGRAGLARGAAGRSRREARVHWGLCEDRACYFHCYFQY